MARSLLFGVQACLTYGDPAPDLRLSAGAVRLSMAAIRP